MMILFVFIINFVLFGSTQSSSLLDEYIENLKMQEDSSDQGRIIDLTDILKNYSIPESEKEEILKTFKFELRIISENDKLLKTNSYVRKTILMVYAENGKSSFLENRSMTVEQKIEELEYYMFNLTSLLNKPNVKLLVLDYFKQLFIWEQENSNSHNNPYTYSFRKIYLPLKNRIIIYGTSDSRKEKVKELENVKVYRHADYDEQEYLETLYDKLMDQFYGLMKDETFQKESLYQTLSEATAEGQRKATQLNEAYSVYNETLEIMNDSVLNNQKKVRKFQQYTEVLGSRSTDNRTIELEHYTKFFNLTLSMNQTLDEVFASPILRKKVLSVFIAQMSTNFSDFAFSDASFDGLSPTEVDILKRYFEMYTEWDYVFQGVFNKPYERFCDNYKYGKTTIDYLKNDSYSPKYKVDAIRAVFRSKYWIDDEELDLITTWYEMKLEENQKIRQSEKLMVEKIEQFIRSTNITTSDANVEKDETEDTYKNKDYWYIEDNTPPDESESSGDYD